MCAKGSAHGPLEEQRAAAAEALRGVHGLVVDEGQQPRRRRGDGGGRRPRRDQDEVGARDGYRDVEGEQALDARQLRPSLAKSRRV